MEFKQLVRQRRSVRSYKEKEVPDEILKELIEAARWAPSAGNCQPWHFYVVKDAAKKAKFCERVYKAPWFEKVPAIITVCADISRAQERYAERGRSLYCIQDTAAAVQNILLRACELGFGTCWIGAFDEVACREVLGLSDYLCPVALVAVGYSETDTPERPRRPLEEISTFI